MFFQPRQRNLGEGGLPIGKPSVKQIMAITTTMHPDAQRTITINGAAIENRFKAIMFDTHGKEYRLVVAQAAQRQRSHVALAVAWNALLGFPHCARGVRFPPAIGFGMLTEF
jgi:hypothetical protein